MRRFTKQNLSTDRLMKLYKTSDERHCTRQEMARSYLNTVIRVGFIAHH